MITANRYGYLAFISFSVPQEASEEVYVWSA